MFQASTSVFLYAVSPVHAGAGTALGLIDNPIQRERHTEHPVIAGSGLKGAIRHHFWQQLSAEDRKTTNLLTRLFGPDNGNGDLHAGAISFGDAQLVLFPVRSLKNAYIYATSPTALARARRTLQLTGHATNWAIPSVDENKALIVNPDLPSHGGSLVLEAFDHAAKQDGDLKFIAEWLAKNALPESPEHEYFRKKIARDLVLLHDADFGYFVRNATVVEPHVRIDDQTGTADGGGLFYTENLPPESLLIAPVLASRERSGKGNIGAGDALKAVIHGDGNGFGGIHGRLLQVGGDAGIGRGQIMFNVVTGG